MKKFVIYLIVLAVSLYAFLTCTMNSLKASEYNTAVIGHVITQKVTGQSIDTTKLMEQELAKIAHNYAIDFVSVLQKYLPSILDKMAADLRAESDKSYKCSLLKDTNIKDDCR